MKKLKISYMVALAFALGIVSCKEDKEEIIDKGEKPEIEFTSHEANAQVWNKVTIKASVTDDNSIEKVEFYAKGSLVETVSTEPFEFVLNTKAYADGALEIKAKAFDKTGNSSEESISLEVLNTLMTFAVTQNYLDGNKGFIFLSDEEGKVLVTEALENGKTIHLMRPDDFEGTSFSSSLVTEAKEEIVISTFPYLNFGKTGGFPEITESPSLGAFKLEFEQMDHGTYLSLGAPFNYRSFTGNCNDCTFDIALNEASTNVLVVNNPLLDADVVPSYAFLENVKVGDNKILNSMDFIPMTNKDISLPKTFNLGIVDLRGMVKGGGLYSLYSRYMTHFSEVQIFYPEITFEKYIAMYFLYEDDKSIYTTYYDENIPEFVYPDIDFKVINKSGEHIEVSTEGDFDYFYGSWTYSGGSKQVSYYVYGPPSKNISINRNPLPQEVLDAFPFIEENKFEPNGFTITEYDGVGSYGTYRDGRFGIHSTELLDNTNNVQISRQFDKEENRSGRALRNSLSDYEVR